MQSIPYTVPDVHHGFSEGRGVVYVEGDDLVLESLVSVLGVADLTYQAQVVSTTTFRPLEIFTFIAVVYFLLCTALSYVARRLEARLSVSDR